MSTGLIDWLWRASLRAFTKSIDKLCLSCWAAVSWQRSVSAHRRKDLSIAKDAPSEWQAKIFWKPWRITTWHHTRAGKNIPRAQLEKLPIEERTINKEVEKSMETEIALKEAERCLSCGRAAEFNKTCWSCLPCEIECPVDALEVRMPYLIRWLQMTKTMSWQIY